MRRSTLLIPALLLAAAACGPKPVSLACKPTENAEGLAQRGSPYDSARVAVGAAEAQICYSRPSAKGRAVFGALVPFDTLWRTGANEPTIIHLPVAAEIAGLRVAPGHYSLYTVPSQTQWQVVVNASTSQWGLTADAVFPDGNVIPSSYTAEVRAQEVGRAAVAVDSIAPVEQLTISGAPAADGGSEIHVDWERTRVRIPIRAVADSAAS